VNLILTENIIELSLYFNIYLIFSKKIIMHVLL